MGLTRDGDLKFLNIQRRVHDTFSATRIDHILDLFEEKDAAIAAFEGRG